MRGISLRYYGVSSLIIVTSLLLMRPALAQMASQPGVSSKSDAFFSINAQEVSAVSSSAPTTQTPDAANPPENLVAVQLACTSSYKAPSYDTSSGHLDAGHFVGDASASTTGMTPAHTGGWGYWTVCHDARGHEHEFTLTEQEYTALMIRGTPQRSVMESPEEAALDAFPGSDQSVI
jgi:hypothetical protein